MRSGGDPNLGQCSTYASGTFSGYGPCFYYSGSQSVTIDRVTATFDVTATPTTVNYNGTVTVMASISPSDVGGLSVPWRVDSTKWAYAFGPFQLQPCGSGNFLPTTGDSPTRTCTATVTRSGTLTVFATVNGEVKQKAVAITVIPPKLKVTAAPSQIPSAQPVTFTASVAPASVTWNVSSWTWKPDKGTGGISPGGCNWFENPCTRTISKSGWMSATATVGEYTLTDSAHVWLVPCPTGDSVMDNAENRVKWITQQDSSKNTFLERGGVVLRNVTTNADSIVVIPGLTAGACYLAWGPQFPSFPGYRVIAFWHTHWASPGYTCTDPSGYTYSAGKGLSEGDWHASWTLYCPLYTIDDKHIWRIDPTGTRTRWKNKRPTREIERDPGTTHCPSPAWPAAGQVLGEDPAPYTC